MQRTSPKARVVCLTSDLIKSRSLDARAATQRDLDAALDEANAEFAGTLLVPFSITLGDEWQGLFRDLASALRADFAIRETLHPLRIASGFGVGPVATELRERTALMDGECFHRSREALEDARRRKGSAARLQSDDALLDETVNATVSLLHAIFDGWSDRQVEIFRAYVAHGTESAAAEALGVTQPTVHQSLSGALAKTYREARDGLFDIVEAREEEQRSENEP
jgi:DNA-binding transcriptional LysR family regulator